MVRRGILLSQVLRSPSFSLFRLLLPGGSTDQVQLLLFWDYASVRENEVTPGNPSSIELSGVGGGLRYTVSRFVDMRADYGRQLLKLPGATELGQVLHISMIVGY